MEQHTQLSPTQTSSAKKSRFFMLTVSLDTVGVVILVFLIFAVLNYFNVLPLRRAFPFLAFLPRVQQPTTARFSQPNLSQKDRQDAKAILVSYLTSTISNDYLSPAIDAQPLLPTKDFLYLPWENKKNATAGSGIIAYNSVTKNYFLHFSLQTQNAASVSALTVGNANTIFQKLSSQRVQNVEWHCQAKDCAQLISFSVLNNVQKVFVLSLNVKTHALIFAGCEADKNTPTQLISRALCF